MLRDASFSQYTSRSGWRYSPVKIDVLTFQSFNSYLADALGCTTYSFGIRLGCSFEAIPRRERTKRKGRLLLPAEFECHFRAPLLKTIRQPILERRDVWSIDPSGANLDAVIEDARKVVVENGLPWFNRFGDLHEVLRTLLEDSESNEGTSGFGAESSPAHHLRTGFVAKSLGNNELAIEHIQRALDSGCFKEFDEKMRSTLKELTMS